MVSVALSFVPESTGGYATMTTLVLAFGGIGAKRLAVQLGGRRQAVGAGGGKQKGRGNGGTRRLIKGTIDATVMCDGLGGGSREDKVRMEFWGVWRSQERYLPYLHKGETEKNVGHWALSTK